MAQVQVMTAVKLGAPAPRKITFLTPAARAAINAGQGAELADREAAAIPAPTGRTLLLWGGGFLALATFGVGAVLLMPKRSAR